MSIQSEQFAKNGVRKLLFLTGSGLVALSAAAALTYGHLQGRSYRQERSQWTALQALAAAENYESCRNQGSAIPSQSRFYSEVQTLVQQCGVGLARQQASAQALPQAIATALSISSADESLRSEVDALVADWSNQVIQQGELLLQSGKLEQAVATLQALPEDAPGADSIDSKIQGWQTQWSQSTAAIEETDSLLKRGQWLAAKNKLDEVASITYWQQQKQPLLEQAEAGIAEVARYEAEQARQRAIAAAPRYNYQAPSLSQPAAAAPPPPQAYVSPPPAAPSISSFDSRVEQLYNSYVAQGQNNWDAWVQACQASGGYIVDQGPQSGCQP